MNPVPSRCRVVGIVDVTPDSFSDGALFAGADAAVEHGLRLRRDGADVVDVGGESTRPGAGRTPAAEERRRVVPVVRELAAAGVPVSIDTTRATTASAALEAGAVMVNDVSGGLADPRMAGVVAEAGVPWVLTHGRGPSENMYAAATYQDAVREVCTELLARVDAAMAAGVAAERLVLDPGFGFARHPVHDLGLLAGLEDVVDLGFPVLVGMSRKGFLGHALVDPGGAPRPVGGRATAITSACVLAVLAGAWGVRVRDVLDSSDAVRVVAALPHRVRGDVPGQRSAAVRPVEGVLSTAVDGW